MRPSPHSYIAADSALAKQIKALVHIGNIDGLQALLKAHPELATARIGSPEQSRTLLHVATDWPGHFPNVAETIRVLVAAGADVDAPFEGAHTETPLHWAASCDDIAALDALLDAGADIEAPGAMLGGGTPLGDACGFGQWNVARRLVQRGASTRLSDAAALGMMDRVTACFATDAAEVPDEAIITMSLWSASNGGQRETAAYLISRGGELNWVGWDHKTCLDVALENEDLDFATWLRARGAVRAQD